MAVDNKKAKCSKSPPLVLSWNVTEPNQHFAQNKKERESVQRNEEKNKDQYNLTFGVYTPAGQTKNDHSQGTVTQIGFILPLQKESNSKKGMAIPEALFLKSHSFQQQQPFEDQQPYLHFDKNAR